MECPNIGEIKFSQISLDAIEEIRSKKALGQALIATIGFGSFANIFVGNGPVQATYSLYSTDFEAMGKSMAAVMTTPKSSPLLCRQKHCLICSVARQLILRRFTSPNTSYRHSPQLFSKRQHVIAIIKKNADKKLLFNLTSKALYTFKIRLTHRSR